MRKKSNPFRDWRYAAGLFAVSVLLCYAAGYYMVLTGNFPHVDWVKKAEVVVLATLMTIIPLHYLCRLGCFSYRRLCRA